MIDQPSRLMQLHRWLDFCSPRHQIPYNQTYIQDRGTLIESRRIAPNTDAGPALGAEAMGDFFGGKFEDFQCVFAGVPGHLIVFGVEQEVAIALADGT
jgi:hypothetical protein